MEDDPVKKRVVMPVILLYTFLLLGLTACGDKLPDLSEDQSELVAEYAAGVALENSENYDSGIASAEEIEKEAHLLLEEFRVSSKREFLGVPYPTLHLQF